MSVALSAYRPVRDAQAAKVARGFHEDFRAWLFAHGYGNYRFAADASFPAFGGKASPQEPVTRQPVILLHGNSDSAEGFAKTIAALKDKGYRDSEIYAYTWGPVNPLLAGLQYHSKAYLKEMRAFVEAVRGYTGADKVDVIAHSMGVTLARKVLAGGTGVDALSGSYQLGPSLAPHVDTFVGIAGANRGLAAAYFAPFLPTMSGISGLAPYSAYLAALNTLQDKPAAHVFSIYSETGDEILGPQASQTAPIPGQDGEVVLVSGSHIDARDETTAAQIALITTHAS